MDRTAIEAIRENTAFDLSDLKGTDKPAIVIPEKAKLVSLESYQEQPDQFVAHYSTQITAQFTEYANQSMLDDSAIYIDSEEMTAKAIFDHGNNYTPLWGKHTSTLKLKPTPLYKDLLHHNELPLEQQTLIDFLSDWEDSISLFDAEETVIPFQTAINRIRKLTLNKNSSAELEQGDFKATASAMETVEIKSGDDQIPAYFEVKLKAYEQFKERKFRCKFRAITHKTSVLIKYRIDSLQLNQEDIANEFKDIINQSITGTTNIYLGTMNLR